MDNSEMKDLGKIFAKGDRADRYTGFRTEEEWAYVKRYDAINRFKSKVFPRKGFLGLRTAVSSLKSLDEVAQLLHETGVASSIDEGREIAPTLSGGLACYNDNSYYRYLKFDRVKNENGQEAFRISDVSSGPRD